MYSEIINQLRNIQQSLNTKTEDVWLPLRDVCSYTKLSPSTIHRAIKKGELKVSRKTGKYLFQKSWIDQWLGDNNEL